VVVAADQVSDADAATVSATLIALLTQMAERSLNDSLPRLPFPRSPFPKRSRPTGYLAGAKLGIVAPALDAVWPARRSARGFGVR
jgi:hypothetical protein